MEGVITEQALRERFSDEPEVAEIFIQHALETGKCLVCDKPVTILRNAKHTQQ